MACESGKMFEIIDSKMGFYPSECVEKFLSLALKCCRAETDSRPSMSEVVRELESIRRMVPDASVSPSEYSEISSNKMSKSSSTSLMIENPFTSSDPSGSDHVDNNIPSATVAPR